MNIRWVIFGLILSLSVGIIGIMLKNYYVQYSIGDILAISGLMVFTTTVVTVVLARVGFAVKRCVARSRWAEMFGILTQRAVQLQIPDCPNPAVMPDGTVVCVVPPSPSMPVFCPDNSGDMLTIFEDYSQYPPQPRRLFDTHRVSPTMSPVADNSCPPPASVDRPEATTVVCLPDSDGAILYVVDSTGSFVPLSATDDSGAIVDPAGLHSDTSSESPRRSRQYFVSSNNVEIIDRDPPPPYSAVCGDPPPPYSAVEHADTL